MAFNLRLWLSEKVMSGYSALYMIKHSWVTTDLNPILIIITILYMDSSKDFAHRYFWAIVSPEKQTPSSLLLPSHKMFICSTMAPEIAPFVAQCYVFDIYTLDP